MGRAALMKFGSPQSKYTPSAHRCAHRKPSDDISMGRDSEGVCYVHILLHRIGGRERRMRRIGQVFCHMFHYCINHRLFS